jgi:4-diphosphocytidyl-2-C-methyl-D-erythritol kinase
MEEIAYAKINLALHVRAKQPDGFHNIETLFAFAEEGDRLTVDDGAELALRIDGPFAPALPDGEDNLVLRAARMLRDRFGVRKGANLTLDKQLPVAAGLGGGSADAAAALRLLRRWWELDVEPEAMIDLAAQLGADVPACLLSRPSRGTGRGDRLEPIDGHGIAGTPLLLVNPGRPLETAAVFAGWAGIDRGGLAGGQPLDAARAGRNDLEPSARVLAPEVGAVIDRLAACDGALLVRMSGSGASCFALFGDASQRDVAHAMIEAERPDWWLCATRLRG